LFLFVSVNRIESKRFQSRSDRLTIGNFEEKSRELEEIRYDCEMNRTLTRDHYSAEIYQFASEEYSISKNIFSQYLFEQNSFYEDIFKYFSLKMPQIESRLDREEFLPVIGLDLIKHCSTREQQDFIAYPIQISIHLLENHLKEEGLFRQAPSMIKFKKFLAQLNLQFIDKTSNIEDLYLDAHVPASALKYYLRELPNCLLTNQLFHQWNQISSIKSFLLLFFSSSRLHSSFFIDRLVMNNLDFNGSKIYSINYLKFIFSILGELFFFSSNHFQ
jgi:hypothetical protein